MSEVNNVSSDPIVTNTNVEEVKKTETEAKTDKAATTVLSQGDLNAIVDAVKAAQQKDAAEVKAAEAKAAAPARKEPQFTRVKGLKELQKHHQFKDAMAKCHHGADHYHLDFANGLVITEKHGKAHLYQIVNGKAHAIGGEYANVEAAKKAASELINK